MNDKYCPVCEYQFKNGDKIVAVMLSEYRAIDSDVHFAIEQPQKCVEIIHSTCFDWQDYPNKVAEA